MGEKLKDASRAAHEIIEVLEDGDAIRNDGVRLTAANKNPWYVLVTIYGEQEDAEPGTTHEQNRHVWNAWANHNLWDTRLNEMTSLFLERMKATTGDKNVTLPNRTEKIDFSNTYFSDGFDISGFEFEGAVNFSNSQFRGRCVLNAAKFRKSCKFEGVTFHEYTDFRFVEIADYLDIHGATFQTQVDFSHAALHGKAYFGDCVFEGVANFRSVSFKSATRFSGAQFLTNVPQFHAANLYDDTVFTLPDNYRENWPPLKGKDAMPAADQKRAYNRLRLFMNRSLQIDEEQFFHRMEMRCKREDEDSRPMRILYDLFEGVSDFGGSVLRPAGWLFVIWLSGVIAKLEAVKGGWWPDWQSIPSAMG